MTWYAFTARGNRKPDRFHATAPDYIRLGLSLCGIDLTRNGWTTGKHYPAAHLKVCAKCKRKAKV